VGRHKAALVTEIIQGKTSVVEASLAFDIPHSEVEEWVDEGRKGLENALRAKPLDVKEQYERQIKELQEAYGEAMLELRARKSCSPCWARTRSDRDDPPRTQGRRLYRLDQQDLSMVRRAAQNGVLQAS
jgi:transposase-like protein